MDGRQEGVLDIQCSPPQNRKSILLSLVLMFKMTVIACGLHLLSTNHCAWLVAKMC